MGFIDKLRAELIDIIEWVDDSRHTLVWRFPRYHNQIKHGAQLIVRPGQCAVFVHRGRIADVFGPGSCGSRPATCRCSPRWRAGSTASTARSRPRSTSSRRARSPTSSGARRTR